jgi:hypothetical protein
MKKLKLTFIGTCLLATAIFTGCDKKDVEPKKMGNKTSDQAASSEVDEALDNVNDVINNKVGGGSNHRVGAYNLPCGVVSIDSSTNNGGGHKIYSVHYGNQTPCGYKYKSGDISFSLQNASTFDAAGAEFLVTFINYTVEVRATGSIVVINGTITTTNMSGGYIWEAVTAGSTITHKVRGTLDVTYSDGTIRSRSYFQQRVWDNTIGANSWPGLRLTVAGDTTINSVTGISETGKTYDGNYDYATQIQTPFVWSNCGTTYAGPYLLKNAHARCDITVPGVTPAYFDVEGGYHWDYTNTSSTPTLTGDCTTNAYKITIVIGSATQTTYQLY